MWRALARPLKTSIGSECIGTVATGIACARQCIGRGRVHTVIQKCASVTAKPAPAGVTGAGPSGWLDGGGARQGPLSARSGGGAQAGLSPPLAALSRLSRIWAISCWMRGTASGVSPVCSTTLLPSALWRSLCPASVRPTRTWRSRGRPARGRSNQTVGLPRLQLALRRMLHPQFNHLFKEGPINRPFIARLFECARNFRAGLSFME